MVYTPEQQAEISGRYPGMEWVNGRPYTRVTTTPEPGEVDYLGQPVEATTSLQPAHTDEGGFPWWALAAQVAAPGVAALGSTALGALAGGGGAGAGGGAAASYGGLPITAALPTGATAGIAAPAAAGGSMWGGILNGLGGWRGAVQTGGDFVSGLVNGQAANRTEADQRSLVQDQIRTQQAGQEATVETAAVHAQIAQQEARQREQEDAYRKAMLGALGQNIQDVSIDRSQFSSAVPTIRFSGGLRPSAFGEQGRAASATLHSQASDRLNNPSEQAPLPSYERPPMSAPQPQSIWERILGPAAAAMTIGSTTTQMPGARPLV